MQNHLFILYNWILWNLAFFIAYNYVIKYKRAGLDGYVTSKLNKPAYKTLFIIFVLYSLFTFFGGDREGYKVMVNDGMRYGIDALVGMENIYVYIAKFVNGNFLLWKLVVYGGALLLVHISLKRMKVNNIISLAFFVGFCLLSYGGTRAVLAYAVYLLGLSYLARREKIPSLIGWVIVISSYFFHNSMIPIIVMTPLIYINLSKRNFIILLLLFPVIQGIFNSVIDNFFNNTLGFELEDYNQDYLQHKLDVYSDEARAYGSNSLALHEIVQKILDWVVIIPILWHVFKLKFKDKLDREFEQYLNICFFVLYLSLLFNFSGLFNSAFMYVRYFGMMPFYLFILSVPFFNSKSVKTKDLNIVLLLMALRQNYMFALLLHHAA